MSKEQDGSVIKKKNISIMNNRSQSSSNEGTSSVQSLVNLENNKRGWLVEPPPITTLSPSRSLDNKRKLIHFNKKPIIKDISQKDILGAVSDEDIFKLTELTSQLPQVSKHHNRHHSEHDENITRKSNHSSQDAIATATTAAAAVTSSQHPIIPSSSSTATRNSFESMLDESNNSETKRRSWFYKSLIKPYKNKINNSGKSTLQEITTKSAAASIVDDFYNNNSNENSSFFIPITSGAGGTAINRRHSFDSFQSFIKESPLEISKEDDHEEIINKSPTFGYSHQERPNFNLIVSSNDLHQLSLEDDDGEEEEEEEINTGTNTPILVVDDELLVTFMFDYYSLPVEIKSLIDVYHHKGKVERKKMTVKYDVIKNMIDEEEEDDDDDDDQEETLDYKHLITGNCLEKKSNSLRDIAIVTTTKKDNIEFTKLIQIATEGPSNNGPLLDLHVSLFGENNYENDFQDTIQSVENSLERFHEFKKRSAAFLRNHMDTMETLNLSFSTLQPVEETESSGSSSSVSDELIAAGIHDITANKESHARNASDPFDSRQKEITLLVNSLKAELNIFKYSLEKTEDLVNDVQVDMDDTRNRMETYIKDIPESHYSALKKLEVDIESILSKRAKNPWLDTGYALLSYLLTLFALVVWIVIYILKWAKKVILFPRELWTTYSDYLVERDKVVKKASMQSVAGNEGNSSSVIVDDYSLFQRSNRVALREK